MANYIPFDKLDEILVREIMDAGYRFIVIQRFAWPSFPITKTFMATAFNDLKSATDHFSQLKSKEGKIIHLDSESSSLINTINSKEFYFFFNMFKEEDWEAKMLSAYKSNVVKNIKLRTSMQSSGKLDITLTFEYGRLVAHVLVRNTKLTLPAYDLLK